MKTKISPAVVGAFVLGAFAIGIITLLALGSLSLFSKPERFLVYFDEGISGLDQGSPVKLRGVRVGHVVDISIRYDRTTGKSLAVVLCELNQGAISDEHGANFHVSDRGALQALVDRGLRAQLEISGLATGLLFVELDFMDPHKHPDLSTSTDVKYVVIPSAPSEISEFRASAESLMANATTLLARMQEIDFKGLSTELKGLVGETRQRLDGVDFKGLAAQWKRTGESVDALARSPDLLHSLENLNKTLEVLRTSVARLDTQVDSNGKELQATLVQARASLESFNEAAQSARSFINAQQNFGADTTRALEKVADAAESIQRLADFLERNPNAIIAGRKLPTND
jgi:paraquat-inducible protein B